MLHAHNVQRGSLSTVQNVVVKGQRVRLVQSEAASGISFGSQSLLVCTACAGSAPLPSEVQGGRFVGQKVVPNLEGGRRLSDAEFLAFLEVSNVPILGDSLLIFSPALQHDAV